MTWEDTCPTCKCNLFYEGPHGGSAMNIKCSNCGDTWWFGGPFGFVPIQSDISNFKMNTPPRRIEDL